MYVGGRSSVFINLVDTLLDKLHGFPGEKEVSQQYLPDKDVSQHNFSHSWREPSS